MAGHISVTLQNFDEAEEFYKRVLEIDPQHQDAGLLPDNIKVLLLAPIKRLLSRKNTSPSQNGTFFCKDIIQYGARPFS